MRHNKPDKADIACQRYRAARQPNHQNAGQQSYQCDVEPEPTGDLFASVGAGARASVANYKVARETEYQRQMERTKARLRLMLEQ